MNPRRAALVGLVFLVIAVFYFAFQTVGGAVRHRPAPGSRC